MGEEADYVGMRRRPWKKIVAWVCAVLCILGFTLLNVVAYSQARAMTTFSAGGEKTRKPEALRGLAKIKVLLKGVNLPRPENSRTPQDKGLGYEVHRFHSETNIEIEAWYIPHPKPRAIALLLPGYGSAKASMLEEAEEFNRLGCSAYIIDFRGHGGSSGNVTSIGYHEAKDVEVAVQFIHKAVSDKLPLVIYGNSMGAAAMMRAVAAGKVEADAYIIEGVFETMLSAVQNRFRSMRVPSFPSAQLLVFWGGRQQGFRAFGHNPVDYARKLDKPALMIHGAEDRRATLEQAKRVLAALKVPGKMEVFEGVGHESCIKKDRVKWKAAVGAFLGLNVR